MKFNRTALAAAAMVVLLSACGGDNNDDNTPPVVTPPPTQPPTTTGDVPNAALATPSSFVDYVGSLQSSATALPLNVTGVNPPTTETGLPKPL